MPTRTHRPLPSQRSQSGHFTAGFGGSSAASDEISAESTPSSAANSTGAGRCTVRRAFGGWTEKAAADTSTASSGAIEEINRRFIVAFEGVGAGLLSNWGRNVEEEEAVKK